METSHWELQCDRRQYIADRRLANADVIRAMHGPVQLCQDPQTEFALLRHPDSQSARSRNPSRKRSQNLR